ncbi:MAG: hypothetical protein ACXWSC_08615, partial [Bdellovibrionota bacterium]
GKPLLALRFFGGLGMLGVMVIVVIGLPCLAISGWFGRNFFLGNCFRILPYGAHSPPLCGSGVLALTVAFLLGFTATCGLAWYWRE